MNFNLDLMLPYKNEVKEAIDRVVEDKQYILGWNVDLFEREFARYTGQAHAVGVGNGTDAIRIALLALGVKPGDEVISPAFNVAYTALAVAAVGATNVFVDRQPGAFIEMDIAAVKAAITPKTRAIIAVHLFGKMQYMEELSRLAKEHGLLLIEDAAQAHGARDADEHGPGWHSHAVAYSFYPTKNLGALGEAGAITTNIPVVAERARLLRDGGRTDRYLHVLPGINSCLDEMQAAILRVKLPYLDERNQRRLIAAQYYNAHLMYLPELKVPLSSLGHVYHLYVIQTNRRDELREFLAARNIPTLVHYPVPVPYQPCFMTATMGGPWPNAEKLAREVLSLPMHADITVEEQDKVIGAIKDFFA